MERLVISPPQLCDCLANKTASDFFNHSVTRESLWADSCSLLPGLSEELPLRNRGLLQVNGEQYDVPETLPAVGHDERAAFVSLVRACTKNKDLYKGTQLHDDILKRGLLEKCSDALVTMYAKCGEVGKARTLLDMHKSTDVVAWTSLIAGYVREGLGQNALDCYGCMRCEGIAPNGVTYLCVLKACAMMRAMKLGKEIHDSVVRQGLLQKNSLLGNALVDMYAKCGALSKAQDVLEELHSRDAITWNALIAGYAQEGQLEEALNCLGCMRRDSILPDAVTYICVLKACASNGARDKGKEIHDIIVRQGLLQNNIVLGNALVGMYAKCRDLSKAKEVLEKLPHRNVVSWSTLISGYAEEGQGEQALNCFDRMQEENIPPDAVTYVCLLKACASIKDIDKGEEIHDRVRRYGLLQNNLVLGNTLVDMYAKCGALSKAQDVLEKLASRNVITWNALITGYIQDGQGELALHCFDHMQHEGISPNEVTYLCILKACVMIGAIAKGKEIHDSIVRYGLLQNNVALGNALVDMYAKCGTLSKAEDVLKELPCRTVVSWSTLIAGYTREGRAEQALACFEEMQRERILPDVVTYICILQACAAIGAVEKGKQIHDDIMKHGFLNNKALGNALVDMFAKCGDLSKARDVLEKLPSRDAVSWSALIAGYAEEGQGEQALNCFECMRREGIPPDAVTYVCVLKACAAIGATDKGKEIHGCIVRQGLLQNEVVGNALIDMYAKCGALSKAEDVLGLIHSRDVVSWNALISGYAQGGRVQQARNCIEHMQLEGISPNAVTFLCVLNVCCHLGLVDEGHALFVDMLEKYGVNPNLECCACIVDLYGRAGHLEKAVRLIQEMPSSDHSELWLVLLGACRKWGQVDIGRWAFERAMRADKSDGPAYVLMANIYGGADMQEESQGSETLRMRSKAWKKPVCSWWTDANERVHTHSVGNYTIARSKGFFSNPEWTIQKMSRDEHFLGPYCLLQKAQKKVLTVSLLGKGCSFSGFSSNAHSIVSIQLGNLHPARCYWGCQLPSIAYLKS